MTKLNWNYDTTLNCEVAFHNGYRIRVVHDEMAENPFAWGDVYGYVIERYLNHPDIENDDDQWEEVSSSWSYYGNDHAKSGPEEAALESVPDEPVGSPDALVEELQ